MRVVAIQHVKTRYYVAMNAAGKLYCQATFNADCKFKENIFENYWNIYARLASIEDTVQNVWPHTIKLIYLECSDLFNAPINQRPSLKRFYQNIFLLTIQKLLHMAINAKGVPVKGEKAQKDQPCAHFLPHAIESVFMVQPEVRDESTKVSVMSGSSINKP